MTFAELFEWVEKNNIDWQSEIYYERIEDYYFEKGNWKPKVIITLEYLKVESPVKHENEDGIFLTAHY